MISQSTIQSMLLYNVTVTIDMHHTDTCIHDCNEELFATACCCCCCAVGVVVVVVSSSCVLVVGC